MDRNYYYRILGVRSDATPKQIKAAYDARIARLNSADYDDEPEYARRKKEQATNAYRVLTGAAPVVTKEQKENRFERFKDKIERKEGFKINLGKRPAGNVGNKGKAVVVTTVISIIIAVIGLISAVGELISDNIYDPSYEPEVSIEQELMTQIDDYAYLCNNLIYYDKLDQEAIGENEADVLWGQGWGDYGEEPLASDIGDLIYSMGIYNQADFFDYVTGVYDYYFDFDDYDLAYTLIDWMGAPEFDEIAGSINMYTGEPILDLSGYINYLEEYVNDNVEKF